MHLKSSAPFVFMSDIDSSSGARLADNQPSGNISRTQKPANTTHLPFVAVATCNVEPTDIHLHTLQGVTATPGLLCVCPHMCAVLLRPLFYVCALTQGLIPVLSLVCPHMRARPYPCSHMWPLMWLYVSCSHMCALTCVLSCVCSDMFAFMSCVCSCVCALGCGSWFINPFLLVLNTVWSILSGCLFSDAWMEVGMLEFI